MAGSTTDPRKLKRQLLARSQEIVDLSWQLATTGVTPGRPPIPKEPKARLLAQLTHSAHQVLSAAKQLK